MHLDFRILHLSYAGHSAGTYHIDTRQISLPQLFKEQLKQRCFTLTQCHSVSTFESEVRNSLSTLEPCSMDSLGHQHLTKKLSPKIVLHFKVLCQSKAMLPKFVNYQLIDCESKS